MRAMLETCISGPVLPATILLGIVTFYWLMVIIGSLDLQLFDFDLDFDGDVDPEGVLGAGMVGLRFLNLGRIPLMLWMSVFALSFWFVSMLWYDSSYAANATTASLVVLRNAAIGVVMTKVLTQPLLQLIDKTRTLSAYDLVGQVCVISTDEVNDEKKGQAKLGTEASPLLLNVRGRGAKLVKGDLAKIVEFDPNQHIYYVQKADSEGNA